MTAFLLHKTKKKVSRCIAFWSYLWITMPRKDARYLSAPERKNIYVINKNSQKKIARRAGRTFEKIFKLKLRLL